MEVMNCIGECKVKLASLHIDQFGARRDFELADFTDHLNVIYGPNGSGKTTVIQFIRWMIFGDRDELSRRYLNTSDGPAAGALTVRDHLGTRTLRRRSQAGSLLSELTVQGQAALSSQIPVSISNAEFDRFFVISFDRARNLADLINSANLHGLQLHIDHHRHQQATELRERIDRHREELQRFGYSDSHEQLSQQRDQKHREIAWLQEEWTGRRRELGELRPELEETISDHQSRVERLRNVVANLDHAIESRKHRLAEEHHRWLTERREFENRQRWELHEIDSQLSRWQEVLADVRSRLGEIRSRQLPHTQDAFMDGEESQLFLKQLGFRIRDIKQDISSVYQAAAWNDHESDAHYLRGLLGAAMDSMQNELFTLGQSIEKQQQINECQETREELNYLSRVEKELVDLIESLNQQRNRIYIDPLSASHGDQYVSSWPDLVGDDTDSLVREKQFSLSWDHLDDFRLRHLTERREAALARQREAERELAALDQRLRDLVGDLGRLEQDPRVDSLQRDIRTIEEKIRLLEQRESLTRTISELEDQWRRLRETAGTSQTAHRASEYLRRLTNEEFNRIEISEDHRCRVVANSKASSLGSMDAAVEYDYSQLNRGVQDQVYLSLVFGIVDTLRERGSMAPIILNDVFSNLDQHSTRRLAEVLSGFSSRQQTFVFTRHDHVQQLFRESNARVFTLREDIPQPLVPQLPPTPKYTPPKQTRPVYDSAVDLTPPPSPSYKWVAEWQERQPVPTNSIVDEDSREVLLSMNARKYPSLTKTEPEARSVVSPSHPLISLQSPLRDISLLGDEFVEYMRRISITTVGEFLDLDPGFAVERLGQHGITLEIVQRRQREIMMMVYVRTNANDAQLLVACGVPDPARLARADEAVLLKRVDTVLSRPFAADRFGTIERYGIERVRQWIQSARASNYSPRGKRERTFRASPPSDRFEKRKSNGAATQETIPTPTMSDQRLRFYLEPKDPVVDAPSIGPKTAEKLHAVSIMTVADLLAVDPDQLAQRLDDRRISAETIKQWQLQAELVCCVPNLRGHDAQILVACGIEDPVTLASQEPGSFLSRVSQFVNSKEGQRAIRSAKKPDLAEVTAWIQWAESARQLRAA